MILCEYGCGKEATHQFKNDKWCCSKSVNSCINKRTNLSNSLKGRFKRFGKQNHMYNKQHTNKAKLCMSISHKPTIKQLQEKYPTFAKIEEMRYEPGKEKEKIIQVHCKNHLCKNSKEKGSWFTPTTHERFYFRIWSIENDKYNNYYYCSEHCKDSCSLYKQRIDSIKKIQYLYTPTEYQTWRLTVLKREDYKCEYCNKKANIVHHIMPQKLEPIHVLDPDYGVACCQRCHYKYGHKDECGTGVIASKICK